MIGKDKDKDRAAWDLDKQGDLNISYLVNV